MKYITQCNWNNTWHNILTYAESIRESEENCRCLFGDRRGFRMFQTERYKGSSVLPSVGLFTGLIMGFLSFALPTPFAGIGFFISLLLIIVSSPKLKEIKKFEEMFSVDNDRFHIYEYEYTDCTKKKFRNKLKHDKTESKS